MNRGSCLRLNSLSQIPVLIVESTDARNCGSDLPYFIEIWKSLAELYPRDPIIVEYSLPFGNSPQIALKSTVHLMSGVVLVGISNH